MRAFILFLILCPFLGYAGELKDSLRHHVEKLAGELGDRNASLRAVQLEKAAAYIESFLKKEGFDVTSQYFSAGSTKVRNIIASIAGDNAPQEILVVGAHYDTCFNPGADDNASGVAGLLELAKICKGKKPARTVRFVAFVNEEPPYYQEETMGSLVYAKECRAKNDKIKWMINLESIGYFSDKKGSQEYPEVFKYLYPDTGNFISIVGNISSRGLVSALKKSFKQNSNLPVETVSAYGGLPGLGMSDHWSFWQCGYNAVMVTDTALFRNKNYHTPHDLPETLDYERMGETVRVLGMAIDELAGAR